MASASAFWQCRSMRSPKVSRPCMSWNALKGESAAPLLRRGTTLHLPIKAAGPSASV